LIRESYQSVEDVDMSGLVLLENTINAMLTAPRNSFVGGQAFNASYALWPLRQGVPPTAGHMTTGQLQQRLINLRVNFDRLPLSTICFQQFPTFRKTGWHSASTAKIRSRR
jgi:hypothetical protein